VERCPPCIRRRRGQRRSFSKHLTAPRSRKLIPDVPRRSRGDAGSAVRAGGSERAIKRAQEIERGGVEGKRNAHVWRPALVAL